MVFPWYKDKYRILLVHREGNVTKIIRTLKLKKPMKAIRWGKKAHPIAMDKPAYRRRNIAYYVVDIDKGQLNFGERKPLISPELFYTTIYRELAKQLVSSLETRRTAGEIMMIIMAALVGLSGGYIIAISFG